MSDDKKRRSFRLTEREWEDLKVLGYGDATAGLRTALHLAYEWTSNDYGMDFEEYAERSKNIE